MRRTSLCLVIAIAFASGGVAAREVKLSSADGGSCPDAAAQKAPTRKSPVRDTAPVRESRSRPALHSDSDVGTRPTRWHSFIPGMFR